MRRAAAFPDPLRVSRASATRFELEAAIRALAAGGLDDHAAAALLELDVASVRRALSPRPSIEGERS